VNASGCTINTCGWINGLGLAILFHAIQCFGIDHVVVLGPDNGDSSANCADTENLMRKLTYAFGNRLRIHAVPKSSGVVVCDKGMRQVRRQAKIREYVQGRLVIGTTATILSTVDATY
jgi:polyribonucleotide 5'-hydroxyl-kinase